MSTAHALVARLDNDGDVLLAGPAVRAVAAGADRVTLLVGPRGAAAARLLPGVDEIVVWRAPWIDPEPEPVDRADVLGLLERLGALRPDHALILTSFHQSALPLALLLRMAGVPVVAACSEDYPGSLLDVRHRLPGDPHEAERGLSLAATLGYRLPPGDDGALRVRGVVRHERPSGIVVHPGASVPARTWRPERWAEVVDALAETGERVTVTGSAGERSLTALVAGPEREAVTDLGGRTDLRGLAEVLAGARALVVGNTGPAHLAAAVGCPVVSLFAPTVPPARWHPWGVPHEVLYAPVPCAGCRARVCPVPGQPCLGGVGVEDVLAAVDALAPREVAAA
jgi:ADP-heptose:LPS heptosyltransferase